MSPALSGVPWCWYCSDCKGQQTPAFQPIRSAQWWRSPVYWAYGLPYPWCLPYSWYSRLPEIPWSSVRSTLSDPCIHLWQQKQYLHNPDLHQRFPYKHSVSYKHNVRHNSLWWQQFSPDISCRLFWRSVRLPLWGPEDWLFFHWLPHLRLSAHILPSSCGFWA